MSLKIVCCQITLPILSRPTSRVFSFSHTSHRFFAFESFAGQILKNKQKTKIEMENLKIFLKGCRLLYKIDFIPTLIFSSR